MIEKYTIKLKNIFLVITTSILVSCSSNFKNDLNHFKKNGWVYLDNYNFKIDTKGTYETEIGKNIVLFAKNADTIVRLEYLKKSKNIYPPSFQKIIKIKKINDLKNLYRVLALNKDDTLFDYNVTSQEEKYYNFEDMIFRKGKYYYMYKKGKLSYTEEKFYEKHMDSLNMILGNALPNLVNDTIY